MAPCNQEIMEQPQQQNPRRRSLFRAAPRPPFPAMATYSVLKNSAISRKLPLGVQRAHYMAYKDLAQAAAPDRLIRREMEP